MDIYWCDICKSMQRFLKLFHVGKNENIGICKKCKTVYSKEQMNEN